MLLNTDVVNSSPNGMSLFGVLNDEIKNLPVNTIQNFESCEEQIQNSKEWLFTNFLKKKLQYTPKHQKSVNELLFHSAMRSLYDSWVMHMKTYDVNFIYIKDFHFYNYVELNESLFIKDD